jgi:hypothetical protein
MYGLCWVLKRVGGKALLDQSHQISHGKATNVVNEKDSHFLGSFPHRRCGTPRGNENGGGIVSAIVLRHYGDFVEVIFPGVGVFATDKIGNNVNLESGGYSVRGFVWWKCQFIKTNRL